MTWAAVQVDDGWDSRTTNANSRHSLSSGLVKRHMGRAERLICSPPHKAIIFWSDINGRFTLPPVPLPTIVASSRVQVHTFPDPELHIWAFLVRNEAVPDLILVLSMPALHDLAISTAMNTTATNLSQLCIIRNLEV
jgi:hypothetical protein